LSCQVPLKSTPASGIDASFSLAHADKRLAAPQMTVNFNQPRHHGDEATCGRASALSIQNTTAAVSFAIEFPEERA
jgi:hypothetical protein